MGLDLVFDYLKIAKKKRKQLFLINGTAETLPYRSECFDIDYIFIPGKICEYQKEL